MVVVNLMHTQPIAVSDPALTINLDDSVDAANVEVRGVVSDVNVWDSEW